jgi:outer membrane protein TolC
VAANRRALDLATERYTSGLESYLAVLDAQRSVYSAEDQLALSERDLGLNVIALNKALGGGWTLEKPLLDETVPTKETEAASPQ